VKFDTIDQCNTKTVAIPIFSY